MPGRRWVAAALGLGLGAAASARDFRAWQGLHEGMLREALDGDLRGAAAWYTALLDSVPEEDTSRGPLTFWLGRAWYLLGEVPLAVQALQVAALDPRSEPRALALLGQIDALEHQVTQLPLTLDFDVSPLPWLLHAWELGAQGRLSVEALPDGAGGALVWDTLVAARDEDQIQVWFAAEAANPAQLSVLVRADPLPAWLTVLVMDPQERWYGAPEVLQVPADQWLQVELDLADFRLLPAERGPGPADAPPGQVRTLALRDVTAVYSTDRGANRILLDQVRIR